MEQEVIIYDCQYDSLPKDSSHMGESSVATEERYLNRLLTIKMAKLLFDKTELALLVEAMDLIDR